MQMTHGKFKEMTRLSSEITCQAIIVREKQKAYFADRKQQKLVESKQAEKALDELIEEFRSLTAED